MGIRLIGRAINMISPSIKRNVRRIALRFGLWSTGAQAIQGPPTNGEKNSDWYDGVFANANGYHQHYSRSCYYFIWSVIVDRMLRDKLTKVLEIGCGPGQFAAMLFDNGIRDYVGLDFSSTAIAMARENAPSYSFIVGDARTSDVYSRIEHDVLVCTEVLEHIEEDLVVVSNMPAGKRCFCTVPNFPYESHVRHFTNSSEVADRYGKFFETYDVRPLKGSRTVTEEFFLIDGTRNSVTVQSDSSRTCDRPR
jgi:SAM-dependent methyltransferase